MRLNVRYAIGVIGLCILENAAVGQNVRMPRGAFLARPATDAQALSKQVGANPRVLDRYVETFNLAPDVVKKSFAHLHLVTLKKDGFFQVHYVHPGEHLGYRIRRVPKGTPVFATPDGTPILVKVCGNPLRSGPDVALLNAGTQTGRLTIPDFQPDEPRLALASDFVPTSTASPRSTKPVADVQDVVPEAVATTVESPLPPVPLIAATAGGLGGWAQTGGFAAIAGGILSGLSGGGNDTPTNGDSGNGSEGTGFAGGADGNGFNGSAQKNPGGNGFGGSGNGGGSNETSGGTSSGGDPGQGGGGGGSSGTGGGGGGGNGSGGNGGGSGSGGGGGSTTTPEPGAVISALSLGTTVTFWYRKYKRKTR